jgi:signal peptidase I
MGTGPACVETMTSKNRLRQFFFPSITHKFLLRVAGVALSAFLIFTYVLIPIRIQGSSMEPTYHTGSINFCFTLSTLFAKPQRYDVVAVRLAGQRIMLLKRVVALEGERIEFRHGKLLVDGDPIDESYVRYPCDWNLPSRQVEPGFVYVVGDNRSMPIGDHYFGQASIKRIVGVPLW